MHAKNERHSLILAQCRYTEIAQRIFKYSNIQYTSLTLDKKTEQFDVQNAIVCQLLWELQTLQSDCLAHLVQYRALI